MSQEEITSECWCYALKRTVKIRGFSEGKRLAVLLRVKHCEIENMCAFKRDRNCLIGTLRDGRW